MKGIGGFFDKFKNLALKQLYEREIVTSAIFEYTKQKIELTDINIKDSTVIIKGNQTLKSEIFLKKYKILEYINSRSKKRVADIK